MSVLELSGRPYVVFDPANADHRRFYHDFVKTGMWGRCPYRFVVPDDHGNLITMIQRSLVTFYVNQEFSGVRRRVAKTQRTKG
jgi:hypothetical protein